MFGFHRFGDLLWAAGDMWARGFMLAVTAGRTTLQGEGLQHCDGHSLLFATAVPNLGLRPGLRLRGCGHHPRPDRAHVRCGPEELLYYLTLYNQAYPQPAMPPEVSDGIVAGLYCYQPALGDRTHRAQILASGTAMLAALDAQRCLFDHHDVAAEVWSATSYKALGDEALAAERWNRLHADQSPRVPYAQQVLEVGKGPVVGVTHFVKLASDQIARWMPKSFIPARHGRLRSLRHLRGYAGTSTSSPARSTAARSPPTAAPLSDSSTDGFRGATLRVAHRLRSARRRTFIERTSHE
jgi:pyruvate dehydrogenase E1 component